MSSLNSQLKYIKTCIKLLQTNRINLDQLQTSGRMYTLASTCPPPFGTKSRPRMWLSQDSAIRCNRSCKLPFSRWTSVKRTFVELLRCSLAVSARLHTPSPRFRKGLSKCRWRSRNPPIRNGVLLRCNKRFNNNKITYLKKQTDKVILR